jgi:hypothetical protein
VAYNLQGFEFKPEKPTFVFNPSNVITRNTENLYFPTCQNNLAREAHHKQIAEYANAFGMTITYQPVKYDFKKHNFIYGEEHSGYHYARKMKAVVDFKQYGAFFSKFGFQSNEELTVYIPIREFERIWGDTDLSQMFPLPGDVFLIDQSACDRPLRQTERLFTVTERSDTINPVDFLGGHYVYKLDCKRFDYSYEENVVPEKSAFDLNEILGDSSPVGKVEGPTTEIYVKTDDVDAHAKANFDNKQSSAYGKYL